MFAVIKAEIVTQESISLARPYVFPDNSDNITSFTGRTGQILLPSMLLQDVLDKLPQGTYVASHYENLLYHTYLSMYSDVST